MDIFLISNMYPSQRNPGYGVFVKNVVYGLKKYNVNTKFQAVISGKGGGFFSKLGKYIRFYFDIIRYYFRSYDCIYVHYPTYSSVILALLKTVYPRPYVMNYHGEDLLYNNDSFVQRLLGRISDRLASEASFIVVPSDYYKQIVIERKLADNTKIFVSPSGGIDNAIFNFKGSKHPGNFLHIGFVGRLERDKGILEFIDACIKLNSVLPIKATIIGYGPLKEIVANNISDYNFLTFIQGVKQDQLPDFYNSFDLFCFPSQRKAESLGLVGIEAMACGTPVMGSDIGGIKSYVRHSQNGFLLRLDCLTEDIVDYCIYYSKLSSQQKTEMMKCAIATSMKYNRDTVCESLSTEFKNRI